MAIAESIFSGVEFIEKLFDNTYSLEPVESTLAAKLYNKVLYDYENAGDANPMQILNSLILPYRKWRIIGNEISFEYEKNRGLYAGELKFSQVLTIILKKCYPNFQ